MIGMDRYEAALQLEAQAERVGVAPSGNALDRGISGGERRCDCSAGKCDAGRDDGRSPDWRCAATYAELYRYGLYLDNTGRTETGLEALEDAAAKAGQYT